MRREAWKKIEYRDGEVVGVVHYEDDKAISLEIRFGWTVTPSRFKEEYEVLKGKMDKIAELLMKE